MDIAFMVEVFGDDKFDGVDAIEFFSADIIQAPACIGVLQGNQTVVSCGSFLKTDHKDQRQGKKDEHEDHCKHHQRQKSDPQVDQFHTHEDFNGYENKGGSAYFDGICAQKKENDQDDQDDHKNDNGKGLHRLFSTLFFDQ